MIRKKAWRYKCEYCGKTSGSGGHMSRHEKSCTANPNRYCRMCGRTGIDGLIEALAPGDDEGVNRLRKAANGCPACMLAAVRQSGFQTPPDEDGQGKSVPFNYQIEKNEFWKRVNEERESREHYGHIY
jgi:hypothetical protein